MLFDDDPDPEQCEDEGEAEEGLTFDGIWGSSWQSLAQDATKTVQRDLDDLENVLYGDRPPTNARLSEATSSCAAEFGGYYPHLRVTGVQLETSGDDKGWELIPSSQWPTQHRQVDVTLRSEPLFVGGSACIIHDQSDSSWTDNVEEVFAYHGEQEETFAKDAQPVVPGPAEGAYQQWRQSGAAPVSPGPCQRHELVDQLFDLLWHDVAALLAQGRPSDEDMDSGAAKAGPRDGRGSRALRKRLMRGQSSPGKRSSSSASSMVLGPSHQPMIHHHRPQSSMPHRPQSSETRSGLRWAETIRAESRPGSRGPLSEHIVRRASGTESKRCTTRDTGYPAELPPEEGPRHEGYEGLVGHEGLVGPRHESWTMRGGVHRAEREIVPFVARRGASLQGRAVTREFVFPSIAPHSPVKPQLGIPGTMHARLQFRSRNQQSLFQPAQASQINGTMPKLRKPGGSKQKHRQRSAQNQYGNQYGNQFGQLQWGGLNIALPAIKKKS